jgi:hypothetical protein
MIKGVESPPKGPGNPPQGDKKLAKLEKHGI